MEESGLRPGQIKQVRAFADQQLRKPQEPDNASNRRISVIAQYLQPTTAPRVSEGVASHQSSH
jgi:chemotaxis protein MotB